MSKSIDTLVEDIYSLIENPKEFNEDNVKKFGETLAKLLANRLTEERGRPTLRLSNIGTKCSRKLWYLINKPETAEKLRPEVRFKFLYGDILEALVLFLAEEAGHTVCGQQDTIEIAGVKGHRDAILDGRNVDVKSASTYSFKKFKTNGLREDDPFGYLDQIGAYSYGSREDPDLVEQDVQSFIAIDKQHGHIVVDTYPVTDVNYEELIEEKKALVQLPEPPKRHFSPQPEGKSGNEKLGTQCSYCEFKKECFPNLRTFLYSNGPVYLTKVVKEPKVTELLDNANDYSTEPTDQVD